MIACRMERNIEVGRGGVNQDAVSSDHEATVGKGPGVIKLKVCMMLEVIAGGALLPLFVSPVDHKARSGEDISREDGCFKFIRNQLVDERLAALSVLFQKPSV